MDRLPQRQHLNLKMMNQGSTSPHGLSLPPSRLRFATWNARGLFAKIDVLIEAMEALELDFVFVCETFWDRKRRDVRGMVDNNIGTQEASGHVNYGTAVMLNPARVTQYPVEMVLSGEEGKVSIFRWRGCLFIGCYIPPRPEVDEYFQARIDEWMRMRRPGEPVFLLGDLNMRLGRAAGDTGRNWRAGTVGAQLAGYGLNFAVPVGEEGWEAGPAERRAKRTCFSGRGKGSVVDYIYYDPEVSSVVDFGVYQEEMFSDHRLIWATIDAYVERPPERNRVYKTWKLLKLKDKDIEEAYQADFCERHLRSFQAACSTYFESQEALDEAYEAAMAMVLDSARRVIGETDRTKFRIPRLGTDVEEIRFLCRVARERMEAGDPYAAEDYEYYLELQAEGVRRNTEALDERWKDFVYRFDNMESCELMKVARSFKAAREGKKGGGLASDDAALSGIGGFFEGTFALPNGAIPVTRVAAWRAYPDFYSCGSADQIAWFIRKYPRGKAGGPSGMKMELLKPLVDWIAEPLALLFDRMVTVGMVPTQWCRARIMPIPKKDGATDIKDHRPISLTEVLRKVFEKCLHASLVREIGGAHFAQGGFEPQKGTIDQVAALNETMMMRRSRGGDYPCVAFLDIAKAYDSVDRDILWNRLMEKRCNPALARTIMALFDNNRSRVAVNGRETREVEHKAGLLQGSVLSPTLYNLYIGGIMEKLMEANGGDPLTSFWYADDGAVVARTPAQLQRLLDVAVEHSLTNNFRFNPRKCEVLNCGRPVTIYGEPVPNCTQFKYLGVWFGEGGADWYLHFGKMIEKGRRQLNFWRSVGFNGSGFGLRTRRMIFTTFLRPVVEYGLAIVPKVRSILTALEKFQGEALVAMYGIGRNACRASMRGLAMVTSYEHRWMELWARWEARVVNRNRTHMTTVLRELLGERRLLVRRSCFAKFGSNPILHRHAVATMEYEALQRALGKRYPKPLPLQVTVLEQRALHLRETLDRTRRMSRLAVDADCKARTLYSLSRTGVRTCRYLVMWMLGRYVGKPCRCLVCNIPRCTTQHFIECCGAEQLDGYCCGRRWARALPLIQRILSRAEGLDRADLQLGGARPEPEIRDDPEAPEALLRIYD